MIYFNYRNSILVIIGVGLTMESIVAYPAPHPLDANTLRAR